MASNDTTVINVGITATVMLLLSREKGGFVDAASFLTIWRYPNKDDFSLPLVVPNQIKFTLEREN